MAKDKPASSGVRVKSLFFALYRDIMGTEEMELVLPPGSDVATLIEAVRARVPDRCLPNRVVVAVNQEYVSPHTALSDGDEVAFIPPVAGG